MRKLETVVTLTALLLWAVSGGAQASEDYYTWVDENGVTTYAERAPAGYQTTHITENQRFGYRPRPRQEPAQQTAPEAPETEQQGPAGGIDPDLAIAEEKAKYEEELAAERKHNCDLGKQNLARLETYARMRVKGDDGKLRYLSAAEIEQKKKESRDAIKFHCR